MKCVLRWPGDSAPACSSRVYSTVSLKLASAGSGGETAVGNFGTPRESAPTVPPGCGGGFGTPAVSGSGGSSTSPTTVVPSPLSGAAADLAAASSWRSNA